MKKIFVYSGWIVCCVIIMIIGNFCRYGPVTTVILVRHAEKETVPPDDPSLSAEGHLRAQALVHVVENAGIDAIFVTEFVRTQETVAPAAVRYGITPVIALSSNTGELAAAITSDYRGKEILVAGHSNTIPGILEALGVAVLPDIPISDYDNLFIVHIRHFIVRRAKLTHLQYGNPTP